MIKKEEIMQIVIKKNLFNMDIDTEIAASIIDTETTASIINRASLKKLWRGEEEEEERIKLCQ